MQSLKSAGSLYVPVEAAVVHSSQVGLRRLVAVVEAAVQVEKKQEKGERPNGHGEDRSTVTHVVATLLGLSLIAVLALLLLRIASVPLLLRVAARLVTAGGSAGRGTAVVLRGKRRGHMSVNRLIKPLCRSAQSRRASGCRDCYVASQATIRCRVSRHLCTHVFGRHVRSSRGKA